MKNPKRNLSKYLFSFIPLLTIIGYPCLAGSKSNNVIKENQSTTIPLPCGFPNKSTVPGEGATFLYSGTYPIMQAGNLFAGIPTTIIAGNYKLALQEDGNLVIYNGNVALWSSGTGGHPISEAVYLYMQTDGSLELTYNTNYILWTSTIKSTCTNSQYAYYTFQADGNFVMRYPETINGTLSDASHSNITSYNLGDTGTANGHINMNHKIQ